MNCSDYKMLQALKPFHCPSCNFTYSSRDVTRVHNTTRFPLIVPCSHSACESCLRSTLKNRKEYICQICQNAVSFPDGESSLSTLCPDIHALGVLNTNIKSSLPSIKVKMVALNDQKWNQRQDSSTNSSSLLCGHCNLQGALWQCDECSLNFCNLCFDEVHKSFGKKKKHEGKKIFAELYNMVVQEGCPEHEKNIEFYCEEDNQLTCSSCMLFGSHVGHQVRTLSDKNKTCAEDLKIVSDEVSAIQKRLKYTEHMLNEAIPAEKLDVSQFIKEVHENFHRLHSLLQIRETELISQLEDISNQHVLPLEKMRLEVSDYQKDIAAIKRDAEAVIQNPLLAVSAPALLKKLEECKTLPCHLVSLEEGADSASKIDFEFNHDLEKKIKDFGKITCNMKPRYCLMTTHELPDTYSHDIPENFSVTDAESHSTTIDSFSEDSLSISCDSNYAGIRASLKCRDFTRWQPEKVVVSHIKSPSSFWVQRCCDLRKLKSLSDAIDKWCRSSAGKKGKPEEIEEASLYLVQFSEDKKWYRGRVKKILNPEKLYDLSTPMKMSSALAEDETINVMTKEIMVEIFYIDYGNTEIVSVSKLRSIQARFLHLPGMAKECSLADIKPVTEEWSDEANKTFAKFVRNKPAVMQVYEERNNVLYIDLSQVADNGISNDVPVSVRDALVFLELAIFNAGKISQSKRSKKERQYLPPESLRVNSTISCIVSHVENPSLLYIQQLSTAAYLSSLIFDMNDTYSKDYNLLLHGIYAPRTGMICAAQFSVDKQWYRAKVKSLPGGAKVEVQYVDFGNSEVLHYKYLRKLFDKFCKLNVQAIPCKLVDVTYNQEKCWSPEAVEWLTKKVSKKQLTLKSLGMIPGENKTNVVLYYSDDTTEICVNALIVEAGFAASSGPSSVEVRKEKETVSKHAPEQKNQILNISEPEEDVLPHPIPSEKKEQRYPSIVKSFPDDVKNHIEVSVSHIETPGLFYIQIAGDVQKKLMQLMSDLQKVYENHEGVIAECSVGKAYAVFSEKQKKWFRGTVLSKNDSDNIMVQFVDFGMKENVPKKHFRKLLENFANDQGFSVCCHFPGIVPAGGSAQWSHMACDVFRQLIASHEILHLSHKGDVNQETKSLPADLFIEELIPGGALEPTKIEYKSIISELIRHGLALPIRNKACSTEKMAESPERKIEETINETSKSEIILKSEKYNPEISDVVVSKQHSVYEENIAPSKPHFQWKPCSFPGETKFKGYVTNIGEDGSVHLHVLREGSSQVDMIKKALQFKYAKSQYTYLKKSPPIGEACMAKFSLDSQWYRAEIIQIYDNGKVKVCFVDYGNNEIVPLSDIRTDIIMQAFPRQCLECVLKGVKLSKESKLNDDLLNFLHNQLVENIVEVEAHGAPDKNGKLICDIVTLCGINITELLQSMGFEVGNETGHGPEYEVQQNCRTFRQASELREGDTFPVCVTQVNSSNIVYLQQLKIIDPKSDCDKEHNKEHEAFLQLIDKLQEKAEDFPIVQEPVRGMACCAKYSYDDNWYRCEVTEVADIGVTVLYVDYGNSEVLPIENLRIPENEFVEFPVQVHFCQIHGMKPAGEDWDPKVKEFLVQNLLVSSQEIFAKVVVPGKISCIDLFTRNEAGELVLIYKELVEDNLIVLENHPSL